MTPTITVDTVDPMYYDNMGDYGYRVWSNVCERWLYGQTLTIARHNRSESERIYREHHTKGQNNE